MTTYTVRADRNKNYSIEVEAGSPEEAKELALHIDREEWTLEAVGYMDIYEVEPLLTTLYKVEYIGLYYNLTTTVYAHDADEAIEAGIVQLEYQTGWQFRGTYHEVLVEDCMTNTP